jgi:DNA-binding NarL/FixJ family response regulator
MLKDVSTSVKFAWGKHRKVLPMTNKVLLVEDEALLCDLLVGSLKRAGYDAIGATTASQARQIADTFRPDVAVLDIDLGQGMNGVDLGFALSKQDKNLGLVFLTHLTEPRLLGISNASIPADAAYLHKDRISDTTTLYSAIESAAAGRVGVGHRNHTGASHRLAKLTDSQLEILRMVAKGMTNQEIAAERGTTVRSVEITLNRALDRAGLSEDPGNHRVNAVREFIRVAGVQSR